MEFAAVDGKMNPTLKEKWVEALRSGKFKQTKGTLKCVVASSGRPKGHCCLGVLTEVLVEIAPDSVSYGPIIGDCQTYYWGKHRLFNMLPDEAQETLFGRIGPMGELWVMNDLEDKSFAEIADWIEANL